MKGDEETVARAIGLYRAGFKLKQIAMRLGVGIATIDRWLRRSGVIRRGKLLRHPHGGLLMRISRDPLLDEDDA
jgi:transposase